MPIGQHLPFPREILQNRSQDWPGQPSHPIDFEEVRDYLIAQRSSQKRYYNKRHNIRDLPELHPGQPVLFLSPADVNTYIEGTITGPSTTPHSYIIEAQGRTYCNNRQHIRPIHIDTTPIPRPSAHQGNPISGPSAQHSPISGPPNTNSCQNILVKPSKPSHIPTLKCPASSSHSPRYKPWSKQLQQNPTSHIPTSQSKLIPRPSAYLSKPMSQNKYKSSLTRPSTIIHNIHTIPRPSYSTDEVINILTQLIAMNGQPAVTEARDKPNAEAIQEVGPDTPAPTVSSESCEPTSESQKSTSCSPDDTETDTDSTSSDDTQSITSQTSTASSRTLRPRIPISYNETLLKHLHRRPQIRTLNNLSIPLPDSSNEETEDTDEHTQEDTQRHKHKCHKQKNCLNHCNCKTCI